MRVMVLVKATGDSEAGTLPTSDLLDAMGKYNEALIEAGILKAGYGLKPSSQGKRVRFSGADRSVVDGPFAETKELVAGFWLWKVKDLEEAIAWVKRCPNPMPGPSEIESDRSMRHLISADGLTRAGALPCWDWRFPDASSEIAASRPAVAVAADVRVMR